VAGRELQLRLASCASRGRALALRHHAAQGLYAGSPRACRAARHPARSSAGASRRASGAAGPPSAELGLVLVAHEDQIGSLVEATAPVNTRSLPASREAARSRCPPVDCICRYSPRISTCVSNQRSALSRPCALMSFSQRKAPKAARRFAAQQHRVQWTRTAYPRLRPPS